ncbi:MAG: site-2 protease family protein [Patescibacteria group bacterium]|nr:site-2 protease family protein [Patescibacteria group bacterium]
MLNELTTNPISFLLWVVAFLAAVTVHEFMHAWTANYLGDPTARMKGRISLNPLAHLDIFGTLMILLVGFGWGKPVPVNPNNFKNPKVGWALVSLAGPLANFVLAAVLALLYHFVKLPIFGVELLFIIVLINVRLMVFNLIPIPPLDGSRVLYAILPKNIDVQKFEIYGMLALVALVFLGSGFLFGIIVPACNAVLSLLRISI